MKAPAVLGGRPRFPEPLPFARPFTPPLDAVMARVADSYESGSLTNKRLVGELEERAAERLGVPEVVAVSSCTSGLMLAIQALAPDGAVLLPSFTFSASAHAVVWNGLRPVFAECRPDTFQLDIADAEARIAEAGAILATHVFGAPCHPLEVEKLAEAHGVPAVFDAAHAFGADHDGRRVGGFGNTEVFSLSPTKLVVSGEGGLVATRDSELAARLRIGRDYGNPGDYNTRFVGLNARMSELHAALALESLALLDEHLALRTERAGRYQDGLRGVPGVATQHIDPADTSTYKDFTVMIDPGEFGLDRDQVVRALKAEGVDTRNYFSPPTHRQQAYADFEPADLPVTDRVSAAVTSLPMFARLPLDAVDAVVESLAALHDHAEEVANALRQPPATPGT